jgi:hypothetical protein
MIIFRNSIFIIIFICIVYVQWSLANFENDGIPSLIQNDEIGTDIFYQYWDLQRDCPLSINNVVLNNSILLGLQCSAFAKVKNSDLISWFSDVHNHNENYDPNFLFEAEIRIDWFSTSDFVLSDHEIYAMEIDFQSYFTIEMPLYTDRGINTFQHKLVFAINPKHPDLHTFRIKLKTTEELYYANKNKLFTMIQLKLKYLRQTPKFTSPLAKVQTPLPLLQGKIDPVELNEHYKKQCSFLGTTNALIINKIQVENFQKSYDDLLFSYSFDKPPITEALLRPNSNELTLNSPVPKIFCSIFTISRQKDQMRSIFNTWGQKCSQLLFFSDSFDEELHEIPIFHYGEESHQNMFQKTISIMKYLYKHYMQSAIHKKQEENLSDKKLYEIAEYDWFLFSGDDAFFIMENLISFIQNHSKIQEDMYMKEKPIYFGRKFIYPTHRRPKAEEKYPRRLDYLPFVSGGSGYLLNIYSLITLVEEFLKYDIFDSSYYQFNHPCMLDLTSSDEDYYIANCLHSLSIYPLDTFEKKILPNNPPWEEFLTELLKDDFPSEDNEDHLRLTGDGDGIVTNSAATPKNKVKESFKYTDEFPLHEYSLQRFHVFIPGVYYHDPMLDAVRSSWYFEYDNTTRHGKDYCCSANSISFHQVGSHVMLHLYDYLYRCPMEIKFQFYSFYQDHEYFEKDVELIPR